MHRVHPSLVVVCLAFVACSAACSSKSATFGPDSALPPSQTGGTTNGGTSGTAATGGAIASGGVRDAGAIVSSGGMASADAAAGGVGGTKAAGGSGGVALDASASTGGAAAGAAGSTPGGAAGTKATGGTGGTRTGGTTGSGGSTQTTGTSTNTSTFVTTATATTTVTATSTDTSTVADAIYVAPGGADSNAGTMDKPLYSLAAAVKKAVAGSTIYMRGGTYDYDATIALATSGTAGNPINVWSYPNEIPVLNFSKQPYDSTQRGILLTGNYWYLRGLEICYAGDNGIKLEGSHNKVERCVFHHNGDAGMQLGFSHTTSNPDGELCAYNEIINCDSYLNFDFDNAGSDADGFACKMHQGKGNVFRGCRSWHNGDDGWDLFETDWPVQIIDCWTWHNGDQADFDAIYLAKMGKKMSSFQGNGNGFKLGGNGTGGDSKGTHVVKNCVSFDNNFRSKKGFDQNNHTGGVVVQNCTGWGNGYNFMFETDASAGATNQFDNNVEFGHKGAMAYEFSAGAFQNNNSWQLATPASAADFVALAETLALAPRQADGSLPVNDFARLVATSALIDKGKDVGLPFKGAAPDLGAYECK